MTTLHRLKVFLIFLLAGMLPLYLGSVGCDDGSDPINDPPDSSTGSSSSSSGDSGMDTDPETDTDTGTTVDTCNAEDLQCSEGATMICASNCVCDDGFPINDCDAVCADTGQIPTLCDQSGLGCSDGLEPTCPE